ncbi:MAG: B12-binding domain-containing radical SAM protein [bacterium]
MERNILLINPWIYDFAAYDLWIMPLGLLYLAGLLRYNGYGVSYIDCLDISDPLMQEFLVDNHIRIRRNPDGTGKFFKAFLEKPDTLKNVPRKYGRYGITLDIFNRRLRMAPHPEAVLITSMMTYWYPGVAKVIELVRDYDHRIPILLGGNLVTLCPEKAQSLGADWCISGEGEQKVLHVLQEITGQSIHYLPDLEDLDTLPFPAFDLQRRIPFIPLQTSRGCPFRCIYCASPLLYSGIRQRSLASVMKEIEYALRAYRVHHFVFYDDALGYRASDHLIPILQEVRAGKLPVYFHTPNALHAREITSELAGLLHDTGFRHLRLGFETSHPLQQKITGGKVTNDQFQRALRNLHRAGYSPGHIGAYILAGLPEQRVKEVEETVDFVLSQGAYPVLAEFSPIPGTPAWSHYLRNSFYMPASEPLFHNNSILPCQWEGFSWEDYLQLKIKIRAKLGHIGKSPE